MNLIAECKASPRSLLEGTVEPGAGGSRTGRAAAGAPRSATEAAENGTGREAERGTEQKTVTFHKYSRSSYL